MHAFLDSRRNYAQGSDCGSCAIIYLDTLPEVMELIHSEFKEIEVNEYLNLGCIKIKLAILGPFPFVVHGPSFT
ncbi:hypothetical protein BH23THE1_BH23THE1_03250 [soil metagenome]